MQKNLRADGRTALYRLFSENDELLYVGISGWIDKRMSGHDSARPWWQEVHHATVFWYETRKDADQAETEAIQAEHPKYNIAKVKPFRSRRTPDGAQRRKRLLREDSEGRWIRVPPGVGIAFDFTAPAGMLSSDAGFVRAELITVLDKDGSPHPIPARYAHHF